MKKGFSKRFLGKPLSALAVPLLDWYDSVQGNRAMPWRETRDPYAIWLSETMLQQTQVETVKPYYARFLGQFPTIGDLAGAPLEEVLALWAGLGYYRRAKHLHRAAQQVVAEHGGRLPGSVEALQELPGIGRYTAGAVGSIAFGLAAPVVDGNVMRVLARVTGYDKDIGQAKHQEFFWEAAAEVVGGAKEKRYGDVNQALMELGATVCVPAPARPACLLCPVRGMCKAFAEGRQMELPVKTKRGATPVVRGTAVVVLRERKGREEVLMMQRPEGGIWEGMWEFPVMEGKKVDGKEIGRVLGVKVSGVKRCGGVRHQLTHRMMVYEVVVCRAVGERGGRGAGVLPECVGVGKGYVAQRWEGWPPVVGGEVAVAKVVHKIVGVVRGGD